MRSRTSALALLVIAGFGLSARAAGPFEVWPSKVASSGAAGLKAQLEALDSSAAGLPVETRLAVQFQKSFLQILSGVAQSTWGDEIGRLANSPGQTPVEAGVREVSRVWQARIEMAAIDGALRNYYRHNVEFPPVLADVEKDIPENFRKDPWGEEWYYKPHAPQGFARLSAQRYQLGPGRIPQLAGLEDAIISRTEPGQAWQITLQDVGGGKALEFHSAGAGASAAIIQPGGKVGDCTLLFIGDHWALMAGVDQLFAVAF